MPAERVFRGSFNTFLEPRTLSRGSKHLKCEAGFGKPGPGMVVSRHAVYGRWCKVVCFFFHIFNIDLSRVFLAGLTYACHDKHHLFTI